jgi:ubiquinone/menaquinone biosynthesis C-methylase UbiE
MGDEQRRAEAGIVGVFSRAAATYDRIGPQVFAYFGEWLTGCAQLARGDTVLDVAAGRGAVMFPAARRVGPNGHVIGIDLSAAMVSETAVDIRNADLPQIEVRQMDAEHLDFPDAAFGAVLCGFALWFFPHPEQALREFLRVLRPGGRVLLTTWAEDCPFLSWCHNELSACLPAQAPPRQQRRFDTPARLELALREAGFARIETRVEEADFIYADEEEWWQMLWAGGIRSRLEALAEPVLERVKTEMVEKVQALKQPDGIHTRWRAVLAIGLKYSKNDDQDSLDTLPQPWVS